jgi:hypothetical protein
VDVQVWKFCHNYCRGRRERVGSLKTMHWTRFTSESRAYIARVPLDCRFFSLMCFFLLQVRVLLVHTYCFSIIVDVYTALPATELSRPRHKTPLPRPKKLLLRPLIYSTVLLLFLFCSIKLFKTCTLQLSWRHAEESPPSAKKHIVKIIPRNALCRYV